MEENTDKDSKKYILLQSNCTIAYNENECFLNNKEQQVIEGDTRTKQQIAEELKQQKFYNTFLKRHYKNIVVLTGAGSSMDNGDKRGKSMLELWGECKEPIDKLAESIPSLKNKSFFDDKIQI